jgi:hypothetical protein
MIIDMNNDNRYVRHVDRWHRRLLGVSTFVAGSALSLAVALVVIAVVPGSPAQVGVRAGDVGDLAGQVAGAFDGTLTFVPSAFVHFDVTDPSLGQRLLYAGTTVPSLLLIAEVARRIRRLLREAEQSGPFGPFVSRELVTLAKLTGLGGFIVWTIAIVARWALVASVTSESSAAQPDASIVAWWGTALVFAVFANVMRRGADMRADLDTVV